MYQKGCEKIINSLSSQSWKVVKSRPDFIFLIFATVPIHLCFGLSSTCVLSLMSEESSSELALPE